jgi:hypothetical protein
MATKVEILQNDNQASYGIKVTTEKDVFVVPVLNVKDGQPTRDRINYMTKNNNIRKGSKFMQPSYSVGGNSYQASQKK